MVATPSPASPSSPAWSWSNLDDRAVDTARMLTMDAIERAHSGHPGTAMSLAPVAYVLYQKVMRGLPAQPDWPGRDRFVLSCGHAGFVQYAQLYLAGYGLDLDDLKATRQWGSLTPGHPEHGVTPGVEATTGPLGSGFATAVGMAMAARRERGLFDPDAPAGTSPFDHFVYVLCSDGDLEEGVSSEASSLAGVQQLGNLIVLWDDNRISIDGSTDIAFREDVPGRFASYGWDVHEVDFHGGNGDYLERPEAVFEAIALAQAVRDRPSFIAVRTRIGWPAPTMAGTEKVHGAPLGAAEVAATKRVMGFDPRLDFAVDPAVLAHTRRLADRAHGWLTEWEATMTGWRAREPERAAVYDRLTTGALPEGWRDALPRFDEAGSSVATRTASGEVLAALAPLLPELWGGSADLAESNKTDITGERSFLPETPRIPGVDASPYGRLVHFGIREFAMGLSLVGMALHGPTLPFGATYLVFSDYMRAAVRLAALQKARVIFIWTHDSIGVGEDGPTHQPIEQLASLRTVPGFAVIRPADATETVLAWAAILQSRTGPVGLVLSRQGVPVLAETAAIAAHGGDGVARGAYVLAEAASSDGTPRRPEVILVATGSEVALALSARETLQAAGTPTRVVSMPCVEWFLDQPEEYRESVLPEAIRARVAVEAGVSQSWFRWVGIDGEVVGID
ncbi:MAG TPA: transketolase, partial [Lacisediminihabitans sp.]|uniref:transketolase n=1 Tax=Lacisediminihabitans sp. TaxID=2787631 RepID=UPI002ED8312D